VIRQKGVGARELRRRLSKKVGDTVYISTINVEFAAAEKLVELDDLGAKVIRIGGSEHTIPYTEMRGYCPEEELRKFALVRYVPQAMQLYRGNDDMYKAA
jgi:hypothetical protein